MEKQTKKQSSKHMNSASKQASKSNKNLYMPKIKEAKSSLDQRAKEIIVHMMKIQKKISLKFDIFSKDYNEIIKKAETANKEIMTHLEENRNDSMNIADIQLNQKYANDHENMIQFYENVTNKMELFTNLINSNEYNDIINEFDMFINDKDITIGDNDVKEILDNFEKNCLILKKNAKKIKKNKIIGANPKKILKRAGVKEKRKKEKEPGNKGKRIDKENLLDILQNEFKDNNYIQKISKTFLKRRLFKNVIYRHFFYYEEDGNIKEDKTRSAGESTIYKYGKFTFKFKNDEFNEEIVDKFVKFIGEELKTCFTKKDDENKQFIIGGKISGLINEFFDKIIKKNLYNDYNIVNCCVEFYEFYEELVSEFNENESNVKIINCDEKHLNNLKKDWESLQIVRDFVNKSKKGNNINTNNDNNKIIIENNNNNNSEPIIENKIE